MRAEYLLVLPFVLMGPLKAQSKVTIDYTEHVKPILAAKCFGCHGAKQQQSGLRLDLRQNALRGGDYGTVIEPGNSAKSKLILRVTGPDAGLQMPPTGPLTAEEIGILRAWIDQGAEMPGRAESGSEKKKVTDPEIQKFLDIIHRQDLGAFRRALAKDKALAKVADASGSTALMHAAYAGNLETMRDLLAAGADPNAHNERQATALHWAIADAAKVKLLVSKGANVGAKTVEGRTAVYTAAMRTDGAPVIQILLDAGADPNARMITGSTPLFSAVSASLESTKILLAKGADPNAKSETGGTALMAAAGRSPQAVALLVERGADVTARTKRGDTALANAANRGNLDTVKLLVAKGADVNSVDYRGYTPLMQAAYCDEASPELIQFLLDKGAHVNVTGEGDTPLTLVEKRGDMAISSILRRAEISAKQTAIFGVK